jgi:hypothetical protein
VSRSSKLPWGSSPRSAASSTSATSSSPPGQGPLPLRRRRLRRRTAGPGGLRGDRAAPGAWRDSLLRRRPRSTPASLDDAGLGLFRGHRHAGDHRDPAAADDQRRRRMKGEGGFSSSTDCSTSRSSTATANVAGGSTTSSCWQPAADHGRPWWRGPLPAPPAQTDARTGVKARRTRALGANALRVPWERFDRIDAALHLCCKAEELALGAAPWSRLRGERTLGGRGRRHRRDPLRPWLAAEAAARPWRQRQRRALGERGRDRRASSPYTPSSLRFPTRRPVAGRRSA